VNGEKSSPRWARAFALGCGGRATPHNILEPGPVALFGSPARQQLLRQAIDEGREWYYGDHGYVRRGQYFRVIPNAWQPDVTGESYPPDRFERLHIERYPHWRDGRTIVICPNSRQYMSWWGIDADAWIADLTTTFRRLTDRPILTRWKTDAKQRPLRVDLHDAYLVVAFSSASAVEALAAGVPVLTLAPWASTAPMGITDPERVNDLYYPSMAERDQFLFNLAYHQWTLQEMETGVAWRMLCERD
jgi:hypothetical protein